MVTTLSQHKWTLKLTTLLVWVLAAASLAFWGLRLSASSDYTPLSQAAAPVNLDPLALARMLGANATPAVPGLVQASLASRFALQGLVAGAPGGGAALIAMDGKPAKPYRIGSSLEDGLMLQSVSRRQVVLSGTLDGPAVLTLDMPLRKE